MAKQERGPSGDVPIEEWPIEDLLARRKNYALAVKDYQQRFDEVNAEIERREKQKEE